MACMPCLLNFPADSLVRGGPWCRLVVARTPEGGWSAPSALLSLASSVGWQLGLEVQDLVRRGRLGGRTGRLVV